VPAPAIPPPAPPPQPNVKYHVNGCPDLGGCTEYSPGYYSSQLNLNGVSIFDSGIYYVVGGMKLNPNTIVRPSSVDASGLGGTVFYLSGSSSFDAKANTGKGSTTDAFQTSTVPCSAPGSPPLPSGVPATLQGNILLAPCTGTYGDPLGKGQNRGVLFFQDRSAAASPSWSGGGQFLMAGTMYFHQTSSFGSTLSFGGNAGSATYLLGEIIVDELSLSGNPSINMYLNPNPIFPLLKVALLQ
jgi:hypothetical protein